MSICGNDDHVDRPAHLEFIDLVACFCDSFNDNSRCDGHDALDASTIEFRYRLKRYFDELVYGARLFQMDMPQGRLLEEVKISIDRASEALSSLQAAERHWLGTLDERESYNRLKGETFHGRRRPEAADR